MHTYRKRHKTDEAGTFRRLTYGLTGLLFVAGMLCGCLPQVHSTAQHRLFLLDPGDLETSGIAFLTPSTVTGQEQEKQVVALTFAEVLTKERPAIRCVSLPETLSALNQAGLAEEYKRMFEDYHGTGLFQYDTLKKIGEATKSKYAAQLKLAGFKQGSKERLGSFGLRMIETEYANIRLFFQIWNTTDGTIAWEGAQELHYALDTIFDKPITLRIVLEEAAISLINRLPKK